MLQEVVVCKDNDKLRLLEDNLAQCGDKRVIVFVNTKTHCDVVSRHLDHLSYHCTVLHGGKTQVGIPSSSPEISSCAILGQRPARRIQTSCAQLHQDSSM